MRSLMMCMVGVTLLVCVGAQADAAEYSVTLNLDETTTTDLEMVEAFLGSAQDGAHVPKSVRRYAMAAAGEIELLLAERVGANGLLALDDGSLVALVEGDELLVARCKEPPCQATSHFAWRTWVNPSGHLVFRACRIGVCNETTCRFTSIPPTFAVAGGYPAGKCGIIVPNP